MNFSLHTPKLGAFLGWFARARTTALCWALATGAVAGLGQVQAQEAPYARIEQLLQSGELTLALAEADRWLTQKPRDAQMRFLRAVVLKQRGDAAGARTALEALIREFPELPEPHNNLAVIEASEGRLPQAKEALEMAVRLHPGYATAHRNLGDVYLRLAAQSYRQALLQTQGSPQAVEHLRSVEQLLAQPSR